MPGVPVGEIVRVDPAGGGLTRNVYVRPYVGFTKLDIVGVVVQAPRSDPRDGVLPQKPKPAPTVTVTVTPKPTGSGQPEGEQARSENQTGQNQTGQNQNGQNQNGQNQTGQNQTGQNQNQGQDQGTRHREDQPDPPLRRPDRGGPGRPGLRPRPPPAPRRRPRPRPLTVVGLALVYGHVSGALIGFAAGLLADLAPPADHAAGRYALVLCLVGYLVGLARPENGRLNSATGPMAVVVAAAVGSTLLYAGVGALVGDTAARHVGLTFLLFTAALYDLLLAPFTVPLIMALARRAENDPLADAGGEPAPTSPPAGSPPAPASGSAPSAAACA